MRPKKRYYTHTRYSGIIYAELVNLVTGQKLAARSTGTADHDEAVLAIADWLKNGIPTGRTKKPTEGLINFSGEVKKRGVLTPLEAQALFAHPWKDERAYVGNLLSCTTGGRT
ncbi:hypothetical protein LQZ19_14750 [Treponema primitia]|uniref:hypothetical protein n=1 Tax=Treponema primitia TaxID=88058 RepID=UPI00397F7975